ncbi:MAG: NADP-dependent malic enzyme [Burkholderiaceae bacterium]|nr:NADP-dependent malic enzyme [Burkholderiaceae bacterium]
MSQSGNKPNQNKEEQIKALREAALKYHEFPVPGKISIAPTKQLTNQRDLSLAYTPGVAAACEEINRDPATAFRYTARGNLVGVVTNGTAVLGLGDIGALASKPVMEGKAVLFKKFAGIDVFDIEVNESDPEKLVEVIAALEPTFGGINLEDIKAIEGADVFLGLSAGGVLKPEMVAKMAQKPLVFALANPTPEILPEEVKVVRPDAVMATGRTDYPNQVNNVLCFPFIFRGALDVGATTITTEMEIAAVKAIAELAQAEQSDVVAAVYSSENLAFGPDYLIPKPFDPRLITAIAPAVAKAAMDGGVASRPIKDFALYKDQLQQFVYHSGTVMKPLFGIAKKIPMEQKRIVFCEGEDERVMRAVQVMLDESLVNPILIGRPSVIEHRIEKFGLRMKSGVDIEIVNPESDARYRDFWQTYLQLTERKGVTESFAKLEMRRRNTLIGSILLKKGQADGMICGTISNTATHLKYIDEVIGHEPGATVYGGMSGLILPNRQVFLVDTHVNIDPSAAELAEITLLAASEMRKLGMTPKVALLSHSNFGSSDAPSAVKMREVLAILQKAAPELEVDGEMHGDCALDPETRAGAITNSTLRGEANLLVLPNIDAANISYNLLKTAAGNGVAIGPLLLGVAKPIHILTPAATVRRIINVSTLAVVEAASQSKGLF